ncbi:MFS transporter [Kribbella sp. NPDC051770]|uniref:MFS transporter n=1 Tax=Kribbella sp. NPDC051770 TaxID=3155413 RepID=UPI00343BED89
MSRVDLRIGLALSALGFLLAGLGASIAVLARDLGKSTDQLAILSSAFAVGLLIVAVIGPLLLRSFHIGTVLRAGSLLCAVGAAALALAHGFAVAVAGGLLIGVGGALLVLVAPLLLHGPTAAARLTRVNAVSSATGILAPLAIGGVDALGATGRIALLAAVPPLLVLAALAGSGDAPIHEEADRAPAGQILKGWLRVVLAVAVEFCFVVWAVARLAATGVPMSTAALLGSAFPIGMAAGRAIGPINWRGWSPLVPAALLATTGTLLVCLFNQPAAVAAGLLIAGLGVAPLYPLNIAALVAIPGINPARLAALGALASGTAILLAPTALAALAGWLDLRTAFLIPLPLLAILWLVSRDRQPVRVQEPA